MGICYHLMLNDEFNWGYSETSKEEQLNKFKEAYGGYCELVAQWYGFAVFDIDKKDPTYSDERKKIIREYCERAYTIADNQLNSDVKELVLPRNKPSDQAVIDDMNNRRTAEEKKASEDHIRKVIESKKW